MASLQIDEVHICTAGMYLPGFLISSGQCLSEIENDLRNESKRAFAVIGYNYLQTEVRLEILYITVHSAFKPHVSVEKNLNYNFGIVMVGQLTSSLFFQLNLHRSFGHMWGPSSVP